VCAAAHQLRGLHTASSRQVSVFVGLCVCECLVCVCVAAHQLHGLYAGGIISAFVPLLLC